MIGRDIDIRIPIYRVMDKELANAPISLSTNYIGGVIGYSGKVYGFPITMKANENYTDIPTRLEELIILDIEGLLETEFYIITNTSICPLLHPQHLVNTVGYDKKVYITPCI